VLGDILEWELLKALFWGPLVPLNGRQKEAELGLGCYYCCRQVDCLMALYLWRGTETSQGFAAGSRSYHLLGLWWRGLRSPH
jgi:hypothetical protein